MISSDHPADYPQVVEYLGQLQQAQYAQVSAAAFLAYDICFSFLEEVAYIWSAPWTIPKCLYIFCRYYGSTLLIGTVIVQTSELKLKVPMCQAYFIYYSIGGRVILLTAVDVLLGLRINALYRGNRKVLTFLVLTILAQFIFSVVMVSIYVQYMTKFPYFLPLSTPGFECVPQPAPRTTIMSWIPILILHTIFFFMMVREFMNTLYNGAWWRRHLSITVLKEMRSYSPIVMAFVRDGTIFYLLNLFITVICMVVQAAAAPSAVVGAFAWLIAIMSYSASNLILGLRRAAGRQRRWTLGSRAMPSASPERDLDLTLRSDSNHP